MQKKIILMFLINTFLLAQEIEFPIEELSVESFCAGDFVTINGMQFTVKDDGFCKTLQEIKTENQTIDIAFVQDINFSLNNIELTNQITPNCDNYNFMHASPFGANNLQPNLNAPADKWKFRLYASHSFTTYFDTDIEFRSSRVNLDITNYSWEERGSREFFKPSTMFAPGNNPAQIIDEPTNTFTLSLEKNGHEFFLSIFHPKFLQKKGDLERYMVGTVDGTPVDGVFPINKPFDVYDQVPGELELVRNQNTHLQMMYEFGYGHRFKLLDGKAGSLTYTPSIGVGFGMGKNLTVMVKEGEWWEFEDHLDKLKVQGYGGSIYNRFQYETPGKKFGVFYENRLGYYKQEHKFLDGTQKYDLKFMGNSVGINFMIYNPNKQKKVPKTND